MLEKELLDSIDDELVQVLQSQAFLGSNSNIQPEKQFFFHFVNTVSYCIPLPYDERRRSLIAFAVRESLKDRLVMGMVLALGASHFINTVPFQGAEMKSLILAKKELVRAARKEQYLRFSSQLSQWKDAADNSVDLERFLLIFVLYHVFEMSEGVSEESWLWLKETKTVFLRALRPSLEASGINQTAFANEGQSQESIQNKNDLLHVFIYMDVLGCATSSQRYVCQPQAIYTLHWTSKSSDDGRIASVQYEVIELVSQITDLQLQVTSTSILSAPLISQSIHISKTINEKLGLGCDNNLSVEEWPILRAYISSAFIWLHSIVHPKEISSEKIQGEARSGLDSLSAIPFSSWYSLSLFPFFLIGVNCVTRTDRQSIDTLLAKFERVRQLKYIGQSIRVIHSAWQLYDERKGEGWNWNHIVASGVFQIPLF